MSILPHRVFHRRLLDEVDKLSCYASKKKKKEQPEFPVPKNNHVNCVLHGCLLDSMYVQPFFFQITMECDLKKPIPTQSEMCSKMSVVERVRTAYGSYYCAVEKKFRDEWNERKKGP